MSETQTLVSEIQGTVHDTRTRLVFWNTFEERLPVPDFADHYIAVDNLVKERFTLNLGISLPPS
jgi:hypothetical protein